MIISTLRLRSAYARSLATKLPLVLGHIDRMGGSEENEGTVATDETEVTLCDCLRDCVGTLLSGFRSGLACAGDRHEAELALRSAMPIQKYEGQGSASRLKRLLQVLVGTWSFSIGTREYAQQWREIEVETEQDCMLEAAGIFHGPNAIWAGAAHEPLRTLALHAMTILLLELGYDPEADLRRIPASRPLTTRELFALVAFQEKHSSDRVAGRERLSTEAALSSLAAVAAVDIPTIERSVRLWAARDELARTFIEKKWGWLTRTDFEGPPTEVERNRVPCRTRVRTRKLAQLDHIAAESPDGLPGIPMGLQPQAFEPVKVIMLGMKGCGKTSFWMAQFCGHRSLDDRGGIQHGRQAIESWRVNSKRWAEHEPSNTQDFEAKPMVFMPGYDQPELPISSFDFPGELLDPSRYDEKLQEKILAARGVLFFLDERVLGEAPECVDEAAELSAWFSEILRLRARQDPSAGPLPVAFCIHKADRDELLGDEITDIPRHDVIGPEVRREVLHGPLSASRLRPGEADAGSVLGRLRRAVFQQPENNYSRRLQVVLERLFERFPEAIGTALRDTCQLEIFFASSVPGGSGPLAESPTYGATKPLRWMAEQLYFPFLGSAETAAVRARECGLRDHADFRDELERFRRLEEIFEKLHRRQEALTLKLAGCGWFLRGATRFGKRLDVLESELSRVGESMKKALQSAAAIVDLELDLTDPPYRSACERLRSLETVFDDRRRELGKVQRRFAAARARASSANPEREALLQTTS